jgi:hypothetical protein
MKASTSPDSFRPRWLTPLNTPPASERLAEIQRKDS